MAESDINASKDDDDEFSDEMSDDEENDEEYKQEKSEKGKKNLNSLEDLIYPCQTQYSLHSEFRRFSYFTCFFGCGDENIHIIFRFIAASLWLFSIVVHFGFDAYAFFKKDKYTEIFIVAQTIWFATFVSLTFANVYRSLPRLRSGLIELRKMDCYEKTVVKIIKLMRKSPLVVVGLGFMASAMQLLYLYIDKDLVIKETIPEEVKYTLYVVRFFCSAHVYSAYILFWLLPAAIIYMTGSSMEEYNAQTGWKLRDKSNLCTFKDILTSYKERVEFINTSSSQTGIVLSILLITAVVCFGLNAFTFLFRARLYLHVWHSLVPLTIMIAPLCLMAWTTKQYKSFIMVVLRAWLKRDDLDELSSDNDSGIEEETLPVPQKNQSHITKRKISSAPKSLYNSALRKISSVFENQNETHKNETVIDMHVNLQQLPFWQEEIINAEAVTEDNSQDKIKVESTLKTSFKERVTLKEIETVSVIDKPKFNFEKLLSYLESMRDVVGFQVSGVMMTWDKVSTTLFFMFSLIAVFVQESIFGSD